MGALQLPAAQTMEIHDVTELDRSMETRILEIPSILDVLKRQNPLSSENVLGHTISSESMVVSPVHFNKRFHFHWQGDDGQRVPGIQIRISADWNEKSLDEHVVTLTYPDDDLNREIAAWAEEQLSKLDRVKVRHARLPAKGYEAR